MSAADSDPPKPKQGERNPGASIQARLKNYAQSSGEEMPFVLSRYIIERFLYRLSRSRYADRFVLRGATLFTLWHVEGETLYRPTRDLDVLATGDNSVEAFEACLREILEIIVPEDGVTFLLDTLRLEERSIARAYPGLYVSVTAMVGTARPRLEIDISFGEAISPAPELAELPTLLEQPRPRLKLYPKETVIAEKTQALVELGLGNTRIKDFFDLWYLSHSFSFEATALHKAIEATFTRRGTPFPQEEIPPALTAEFALDTLKQRQWSAFRSRIGGSTATQAPESLLDLAVAIGAFLNPLLLQTREALEATRALHWEPGGPWISKD